MLKLYLLLRNNQESGPYTVDELLQQHLQPTDLIWVEGHSHAWAYPSELDEIKQFLTYTPTDSVRPTPVSSPASSTQPSVKPINPASNVVRRPSSPEERELERKADELRKSVMTYTPRYYAQSTEEALAYSERRSHYYREEDNTHFVFHRRKKNIGFHQFMISAMLLVLAFGLWHKGWTPFNIKKDAIDESITPLESKTQHEAAAPKTTALIQQASVVVDTSQQKALVPVVTKKLKKTEVKKKRTTVIVPINPLTITETDVPPVKEQPIIVKTDAPTSVAKAPEKKETTNAQSESEKKKSFGQVIGSLFKKKKKNHDKETSESTEQQ
jgi:hypothetical protein